MLKKSKHARSGIRTHASTRRPEYPNSSTIAIAQPIDDLNSGALDHSAILAPSKLFVFEKYVQTIPSMCVRVFHLKGGKDAQLSVLTATRHGQYRAANLMTINLLQSARSLPALHQTLS